MAKTTCHWHSALSLVVLALVAPSLVALPSAPVAGLPCHTVQETAEGAPVAAPEEVPEETPSEPSPELERIEEEAAQAAASEIRGEEVRLDQRVHALLAAVDDFADIQARVDAGIVVLSGTVPSSESAAQAVATVERLAGAVLVVDQVRVERGLKHRIGESWGSVGEQLRSTLAALPLFAVALAIVALAWLLARAARDVDFLYRAVSERALLQQLLRQTVYASVIVAGVVVALRFLDADAIIGTALGAAGVLGLALGFAFRNIVENYLAGVLLAVRQPFRARDVVSIDGQVGTVLRMTSSETTLLDADGNHVRLPNAMIFNGKVLNYTRNPMRRFTVSVGVGTAVDLDAAQDLGVRILREAKGVAADPEPSSRVAALGDSSVVLEFYGWVDQRAAGFAKVASEGHRLLKEAFDTAGIDMPPPAYLLGFDTPVPELSALPRRVEPARASVEKAVEKADGDADVDLSPVSDIDAQVAKDLALSDEENLLEGP